MQAFSIIVEQLELDGVLKRLVIQREEEFGDIHIALADEYDATRDGPFHFLDERYSEIYTKNFASCRSQRLGPSRFFKTNSGFGYRTYWHGIPLADRLTYYALSLPKYAIPISLHITAPEKPSHEYRRTVIRDDQNNRFIIYVGSRSSKGTFDFNLECEFIISPTDFVSTQYKDRFTVDPRFPNYHQVLKQELSSDGVAQIEKFFTREPQLSVQTHNQDKSMSQANDIKKLITNYQRRVQKLKEQQALKGLNIEPEILIEIEDIEAEIEKLQTELRTLEGGTSTVSQRGPISFEAVTSETSLQQIDKTALREIIVTKYSLEQVKTLCEDCNVDYEELGQIGKKPLVRELIREMERRRQLALLMEKVQQRK